ncbi:hypothetical protein, partial [Micromonospora sp. CPCC 206061]|uniref:hypothetical protein n=1 Tax=Micromonospora sp. CPCC 206061 TaxID=3122410 RepID=UPI002FF42792
MDQGRMHVEMRSNHVHSPLIDGKGRAPRGRRGADGAARRGRRGADGAARTARLGVAVVAVFREADGQAVPALYGSSS